jgi:glucokinase
MKLAVGLDVGGTNMKCAVVREDGAKLSFLSQPTEADGGMEHVILRICSHIRATLLAANLTPTDIACIGIGIPGLIDPERGIVRKAANLGWEVYALADRIVDEFNGTPTYLDNDVRMAMLGEALVGAGKGFQHVMGVTMGTGLAAAMIINHEPYYGHRYLAGELGHIPFEPIPYRCNCGQLGCLETVASASGLVRQLIDRLTSLSERPSYWRGIALESIQASDLSVAYDAGDELAIDIFQHTGTMMCRGLVAAAILWSPEIIIIGGGGAQAGERILAPIRAELERSLLPIYLESLQLVPAQLGNDAGTIGSALRALQRSKSR